MQIRSVHPRKEHPPAEFVFGSQKPQPKDLVMRYLPHCSFAKCNQNLLKKIQANVVFEAVFLFGNTPPIIGKRVLELVNRQHSPRCCLPKHVNSKWH